MNNKKNFVLIMMALVAAIAMFPSCAASAFEINELPIDYEKIENVRIETPRRNARVTTHVEVLKGDKASISGWIHDYSVSGRTLTVKLGGDLTLTLPENNDVEDIYVAIASGSILVDGFDNMERIEGASAEGDITFRNIGNAERISADSTNGDLLIEVGYAWKVDANSISGTIEFNGKADRLEMSGISGNMRVLTDEKVDVDYDSITGRRDYTSTPGADMKIKASSISGGLSVRTR